MSQAKNKSNLRIQILTATIVSFLLGSFLQVPVDLNLAYGQTPNNSDGDNNRDNLTQPAVPASDFNNINKSIVVLLNFTALNKAEFASSTVDYGPSHSNIGNPPQLRVQNYDYGGRIIQQFNYWHPLFALEFQEDGKEYLKILPNAVGRFVFSFDPRIAFMKISYLHHDGPNSTRAEEVTTVDLIPTIAKFCAQNRNDFDCRSSDLAITDVSTTQAQQQLPILIGDSAEITVQTTFTNRGPDTPIDAILLTKATTPSGSDGIRVTTAAGANPDDNGEAIMVTSLNQSQQYNHAYNIECWEPGKYNIIFESEIAFQSGAVIDANKLNNKGQMNLEVDCGVIDEKPREDPLTVSLQASATESGSSPTTVEFRAVPNGGTQPYKFRWNFDDGSNANAERDPLTTHQFTRLGQYNVRVTITDSANGHRGQTASDSITITINDKEPPYINAPSHIIVQATDSNGANVTFTVSAIDKVDGPVPVRCSPHSGDIFPIGTKTVVCTARDRAGNNATKSFTVTVTPPVCPVENQTYDPIKGCIPKPTYCGDGLDNDKDGLIDNKDPDCFPPCPAENQRYDSIEGKCIIDPTKCSDNLDNDKDGLIDNKDPDCFPPCPAENQRYDSIEGKCIIDPTKCSDNLDNDKDGLIDNKDPDCFPPCPAENQRYDSIEGVCAPDPTKCSDNLDNDRDGLIDGNDPDCALPVCPAENQDYYSSESVSQSYSSIQQGCIPDPTNCSDNLDNDADGSVDSADSDCPAPCPAENQRYDSIEGVCAPDPTKCSDNLDNDRDGLIDRNDPDCAPIICDEDEQFVEGVCQPTCSEDEQFVEGVCQPTCSEDEQFVEGVCEGGGEEEEEEGDGGDEETDDGGEEEENDDGGEEEETDDGGEEEETD